MLIAHLATSLRGGAGIASNRIHEAVKATGLDSNIFSNDAESGNSGRVNLVSSSKILGFQSSANTYFQSRFIQKNDDLVTPFSINRVRTKSVQAFMPEVIHIHAMYNLLNPDTILEISKHGVPILVTLHDQRFFTGGCHYSRDCDGYLKHCAECPQVRQIFQPTISRSFSRNKESISEVKEIYFASPSKWLAELAGQSEILRNREMRVIRNPIPKVFSQFETSQFTEQESKKTVIGFSSVNLKNPYKGWNVLLECFRILKERNQAENFVVHLMGSGDISDLVPLVETKQIATFDDLEMSRALSCIDYLVVPSNSDNLPSVIGEALMAGVRVIGSDAGGIQEILQTVGCDVFSSGDAEMLAKILQAKVDKIDPPIDRAQIENMFSYNTVGLEYKKYYEDIR